jgi:hypothetical protein
VYKPQGQQQNCHKRNTKNPNSNFHVIDINIIIESQFAIADVEFMKIIAIWTFS